VQKVLSIIESHGVSLEHLPSGIDSMSVVIDNTFLKEGEIESIVKEIKEAVKVDRIYVHKDVALVTTVGHGMAKNIGIASRVFKALYDAGVNVNMIDLGPSELNLIVGVAAKDCAACIRAIYHEFF
jgi:aspartate kinase